MNRGADAKRLLAEGTALAQQGRLDEAARLFEQAIARQPGQAEAHYNLGIAHRRRGRMDDAVRCWRRAAELKPDFAPARVNLGGALLELNDPRGAEAEFRQVLKTEPDSVPALINLGNALRDQGRAEEAVDAYRRADALKPDVATTYNNLGLALRDLGRLDESEAAYRRALQLDPTYATARKDFGILLLLTGRFAEGWREYGWRWKTRWHPRRKLPCPAWRGEDIAGKTILLYSEQGLGDTIMFCRLAEAVTARGARVVLEAQPPLCRLLDGLEGAERVLPRAEPASPADVEAPLMDLPGILGLDATNIPARVPYLKPEPARAQRWKEWLAARPGFNIGIVWQGNSASNAELGRSPPLAAFRPLAEIPGVRLIALQKGAGTEQIAGLSGAMKIEIPPSDFDAEPDAFLDSAALMQSLDLVVSADTAPAHLAGALGRKLWIALRKTPDWRWGLDRADTPWYPTARLFRQETMGDWDTVFRRMTETLAREREGARHS